jgi:hypothetical protein
VVRREAGLVESVQRRLGSGRFESSAYHLTIDAKVLIRQPRKLHEASGQLFQARRRVPPNPPVVAKAIVHGGEQLVLLSSV